MPISLPLCKTNLILGTMDKDALVNGLECFLAGLTNGFTKDELSLETPLEIDVEGGSNLLVDQRIIMLQVGTESLGFQGGPH